MNDSKMKNSGGMRIIVLLLVLNLIISGCITGYLVMDRKHSLKAEKQISSGKELSGMETGEKYIIYIGTNDKDTYSQLISTDEARDIVNRICAKYVGGYTASDAQGGWVDETDTLTQENTLVYMFYDISEEQLFQIMDEVLDQLNQNSILVERQKAVYTYYSGEK